jgi:hypothetical protein
VKTNVESLSTGLWAVLSTACFGEHVNTPDQHGWWPAHLRRFNRELANQLAKAIQKRLRDGWALQMSTCSALPYSHDTSIRHADMAVPLGSRTDSLTSSRLDLDAYHDQAGRSEDPRAASNMLPTE